MQVFITNNHVIDENILENDMSIKIEIKDFRSIDYSGKTCLIIGSEGHGIKHNIKENSDEIVSLPMKGKINSLNASVAAGILIYEIMKYK